MEENVGLACRPPGDKTRANGDHVDSDLCYKSFLFDKSIQRNCGLLWEVVSYLLLLTLKYNLDGRIYFLEIYIWNSAVPGSVTGAGETAVNKIGGSPAVMELPS